MPQEWTDEGMSMWRMNGGDRVLTEAEWDLFRTGLDPLRYAIEQDIADKTDHTETGISVFDRLTAEQKLALLADIALAVHNPNVPTPCHTAANEGAIMAVLDSFWHMLRFEIEAGGKGQTHLRKCLLATRRSRRV